MKNESWNDIIDAWNKTIVSAKAMDRIEAAGKRSFTSLANVIQRFYWNISGPGMELQYHDNDKQQCSRRFVPWSAIRNDAEDPLLKAEQDAAKELSDD